MQKGNIGVTTENIFPIIKKFLYSDHEIFLRELVSNAVDAIQKIKTLASVGEVKGELGELKVTVSVDAKKKTLTIADNGIGMTAEEVNKYINQIAFSSAEEFLEKYKNQHAIIGHFGLGFYSSFMVAKKVEIETLSYKEGAKAVKWECDGSPEYQMTESKKKERGTSIILFIDDDSSEFAEEARIGDLLNKYCKFLPIPIAFGKEQEYKDGKMIETGKDKFINNTSPAWTKKPADLKDEDYNNFYKELYPYSEDPLFHIHLNVDYPFNLTGILYFPKINTNLEIQKNKIQLYSNQVFVTDSVEGIVPEFMTLLHGDSPDIPLNVSRSYLQSDSNVKKISSHITKKVADRLSDIFKNERTQFEAKWDDLKLFIHYGMMSDEKFYEKAKDFSLFKSTEKKYFTIEEYKNIVKDSQTDKYGNVVCLYTTNLDKQYSFIEAAKSKGYDVLIFDGQLDVHFINHIEQKLEKINFKRVDADIVEKLIEKEEELKSSFTKEQEDDVRHVFFGQLPIDSNFLVAFEGLKESDAPVIITQSEYMRRMKEMSSLNPQMNIYGQLPDTYNLVINSNHPVVNKILKQKEDKLDSKLKVYIEELNPLIAEKEKINSGNKDKKDEEISVADKDRIAEIEKKTTEINANKKELLNNYGKENKLVKQLIDLALLSNNMLKGEELTKFVKRSVELIK